MNPISQLIKQKAVVSRLSHKQYKLSINRQCNDYSFVIKHALLRQQTELFARSLALCVTPYVFSDEKKQALKDSFKTEDNIQDHELEHAVIIHAKDLFRKSNSSGQFGELILYAILEQYYQSVPIVRKMPITTDKELERNGADAIHLGHVNGQYQLIIGESKMYSLTDSQNNPGERGFKSAIESALQSYEDFWAETEVYLNADFLPQEIREIVVQIKNSKIDATVLLCCLCCFEVEDTKGETDIEIVEDMHMEAECIVKKILGTKHYEKIPSRLRPRFSFASFPIKNLQQLKDQLKCHL